MNEKRRTQNAADLTQINYEAALTEYVDLAYTMMKKEWRGAPEADSMRMPCVAMFVIHNRAALGYKTAEEFAQIVSRFADVSEETVQNCILGNEIEEECEGMKYIIFRDMHENDTWINPTKWSLQHKMMRHKTLVQIEERLFKSMECEAEMTGRDISIVQIKVEA